MDDTTPTYEELDYRLRDGVAVSLVWWRAENRVSVLVADSRDGSSFEIPVRDESPLEVFNHPFAYAAFNRIEHSLALAAAR